MSSKSFIESDFPLREVSQASTNEKNKRSGNILALHPWWAPKPRAASRASIYASLISEPKDEQKRIESATFISKLSNWESTFDPAILKKATENILEATGGRRPKIIDPFAGRGIIPLEALRLGCEAHASDLNPVASLILLAGLVYPAKYRKEHYASFGLQIEQAPLLNGINETKHPLLQRLEFWGEWILQETSKEINQFYPIGEDRSTPIGYYWMRTVKCKNPSCNATIPLAANLWLANRKKRKIALKPLLSSGRLNFEIKVGDEIDFNPNIGTIHRAKAMCPFCKSVLKEEELKEQFFDGTASEKMAVVIYRDSKETGKQYRVATAQDQAVFSAAEKELEIKTKIFSKTWKISCIPDESLPTSMPGAIHPPNYGMTQFSSLFNSRQKLALITFIEKSRQAFEEMLNRGEDEGLAQAIACYVAFVIDRLCSFSTNLCRWKGTSEQNIAVFSGRAGIPMTFDYFEVVTTGDLSTGWRSCVRAIVDSFRSFADIESEAIVKQSSAMSLSYPDNYFDAVFTDPPYYFSVPYADLSDFFYVWLKREIGYLYPDLFATPLTPKREEVIEGSHWDSLRYRVKDKAWFQTKLTEAFAEISRILKPDGLACIVFAHTSTDAWEAIINAILDSGLYLTASWPIHTELDSRLSAKGSAALASSIYLVCRKRSEQRSAYFSEIKSQIQKTIKKKLELFWDEGIRGSDFFISAIGPAVEVFGQYSSVEKLSGEAISTKELLELIQKSVSEYALSRILETPELSGIDEETRFYLLWRWTYNSATVHYDDARKLAQAVGFEITQAWSSGIVKKVKDSISVRTFKDRGIEFLEKKHFQSMVDILHACLLYRDQNSNQGALELLEQTGNLNNNNFWRVAQAISEVLPANDVEKKAIQGFIYGRVGYSKSTSQQDNLQTTLLDGVPK